MSVIKHDITNKSTYEGVLAAAKELQNVVTRTPLMPNLGLSEAYGAEILLKREDLQIVRSYKIRGAFHKISGLDEEVLQNGVVCASAGNHAQGVAYSCHKLGIQGKIFMPNPTPTQKIEQVKMFGRGMIEVIIVGDTFDDASVEAHEFAAANGMAYIPPFNDPKVIEGQGTVALEILEETENIDILLVPVGGGGLSAGMSLVFEKLSPETEIIGVEPLGAPAMYSSLEHGEVQVLDHIDKFVDGAAVKKVGELTFEICKRSLKEVVLVPEGKVCSTILELYNRDAIVVEPAGALTISALDSLKDRIGGKRVVCVVSGSNNDITRTEEIKERSLLYEGLKHYFIVRFPQRAGALMEFLGEVLGPNDDITHFEYSKKNSREKGPALVGIEIPEKEHLSELFKRMKEKNVVFEYLNDRPDLLQYLV